MGNERVGFIFQVLLAWRFEKQLHGPLPFLCPKMYHNQTLWDGEHSHQLYMRVSPPPQVTRCGDQYNAEGRVNGQSGKGFRIPDR